MKILSLIKFIPFVLALLYLILYSILLIGAIDHQWIDTTKELSIFSYGGFVYFAFDNYSYVLNFPLLILMIFILLKIFKKEVFLFYMSLILILIDIYLGGFCMSYWNPHY
jgi:hypothetical protein